MDLETCFSDLDSITRKDEESEPDKCCNEVKNYVMDQGVITCKNCHNTITNIMR